MYADDTLILCKSENIDDVAEKCINSLTNMSKWCEANELTMNYNKTKYMIVTNTKKLDVPKMKVEGKDIGHEHPYEYLGVLLDEHLCLNRYGENVWKKTNAKMGYCLESGVLFRRKLLQT